MSVRVGLLPPTFTNSRVWITRSSFACSGIDSSLISSMNSVPVCASAKNPVRCSTAPVKLPRTCPKRWLSISPSGIAVQSSVTSGRSHRALCAWIARAISSLPVPDSPEMHTFASPAATFSIFASTSPSCGDWPTRPWPAGFRLVPPLPPPPPPPAPPPPPPPPPAPAAAAPAPTPSAAAAGSPPSAPAAPAPPPPPPARAASPRSAAATPGRGRDARSPWQGQAIRRVRGDSREAVLRRLLLADGAVGDLIAPTLHSLVQVCQRLREQNRIGVTVVREGHLAHTHREPMGTSLGSLPERHLFDVRADPLRDAQGIAARGVEQDDRDGGRELAYQVGGSHELGDLLRERPLDLGADRVAIAGEIRAQQADREEVLVPRRTARLASQQVAEGVL